MNPPGSELDDLGRLAEDFLARYRSGERPSLTEYTRNHPELAEQILDHFPALVVLEELGSVEGPRAGHSAGMVPGRAGMPERLGDYRILRQVGRGGMGIVYEAVQESLGRLVALKVLTSHGLISPTHVERFRREARASARLHHPNIVPVHAVGDHEGVPYYAMQFIQGQGLDLVLEAVRRLRGNDVPPSAEAPGPSTDRSPTLAEGLLGGPLARAGTRVALHPPAAPAPASASAGSAGRTELTAQPESQYFRTVARMGAQVAAGLDYAHKQGVLHRDIKPSNLLLDAGGTVWITDFGLAKAVGTDELTHTGDIVGTVRYMAPERFHGWSDPRSDVYGLGITLYEMLTLRPAFADSNRSRLIDQVAHEEPPRPRKVDRSIPRDLETIVLKAIAKEPGRRYQTAAELGEDLERFLAGQPVRARRIGIGERGVKWVKRRPAIAALMAVSAAAVLALIVGSLHYNAQLGAALREARTNLEKAQRAEERSRLADREKTRQLAIARLREAQARRNSGLVGRRFESLEALKQAREHFRALGQLDPSRILELRSEAIACLTLADLKPGPDARPDPGWSKPLGFDPTLQLYVVQRTLAAGSDERGLVRGHLSVRRVADGREVASLSGFGSPVIAARFSPDGQYLAAQYEGGGRPSSVWDLRRGQPVFKQPQGGSDSPPAFSPTSPWVAVAQPDQSIRIHELPSGRPRSDLPSRDAVRRLEFHPDGRRLTVVSGSVVQLRDVQGGAEVATFRHPGAVNNLAWRSDGQVFAAGGYDHDIHLWDAASSARPLRILKGHHGAVVSLGFSRGGDLLLTSSWDSTDRLWDPMTGQLLLTKPAGLDGVFGPEDRSLDHGWQVATGRECRTFHAPKYPYSVAISPTGRLIASAGTDGVRLWDLSAPGEGDKELASLPVGVCHRARFDPQGGNLITDGPAGLQRWPIAADPEAGGLRIGPPEALGLSARVPLLWPFYDPDLSLSADGRIIAHSPQRGQVLVFDPEEPRRFVLLESPSLRFAAFSPDGRWLATGNWQGREVKVWEARTGRLAHDLDLDEPESEEKSAWPAFSPDGRWLVIGSFSGYHFWEVGSWRKRRILPREPGVKSVGWVVFSPDGKMVVLLHGVSGVQLVDPETGRPYAHLPTAGCPYGFSPDGSQLITSAGRDGAFQVWDLRRIRRQLREMDLDWDLPPYPPASEAAKPMRVEVLITAPAAPPRAEPDAQAHVELGRLCVQLREHFGAWAEFDRASNLDAQPSPWVEAARAYSQAIERTPQNPEAYHWRAHAHERSGRWEVALDDYRQAIRLAPWRQDLLICRGRANLRMGRADRAAEDLRKARGGTADQVNRLAWWLVASPNPVHREPTLALDLVKQAIRQAPGQAKYWNTLGVAHYRRGEWEAARRSLERAEELAPGTWAGFDAFFLSMCHHQLGEPVQARDRYDRAVGWWREVQDKLSPYQHWELKIFRDEADALLKPPSHRP